MVKRVSTFPATLFFFSDRYSLDNLAVTLWTTMVCAILLLVICLPIALYLRFSQGRLSAYVQALAIFPMFVPSIILAFAFIRVLGPNGMVDILLNAVDLPKIRTPYLTPWGPVIGLVWDNIPLTVLILLAGLGSVANQSVEAARDVGANVLQVFCHIILPRITNSILVALSFSVLGIFLLHPSISSRTGLSRNAWPFHAAHAARSAGSHRRHDTGRHRFRFLHCFRPVLCAFGRAQPGEMT